MPGTRPRLTLADVPQLQPLEIRRRLGRKEWGTPEVGGDGIKMIRYDQARSIIVSVSDNYPDNFGDVPWIHASICSHPSGASVPAYEELAALRAAVWGEQGWAFQVFAPPAQHIDIRANALHLWGRADGARVHPDFGWAGTI